MAPLMQQRTERDRVLTWRCKLMTVGGCCVEGQRKPGEVVILTVHDLGCDRKSLNSYWLYWLYTIYWVDGSSVALRR